MLKEEGRTMSEFIRDAIRLYMEEREWLRRERRQRAEARRNESDEGKLSAALLTNGLSAAVSIQKTDMSRFSGRRTKSRLPY